MGMLPVMLRHTDRVASFKRQLKTVLFMEVYCPSIDSVNCVFNSNLSATTAYCISLYFIALYCILFYLIRFYCSLLLFSTTVQLCKWHWSVSLWQDPDNVPHCWILSPDKTEWRLISATLCIWRCCFVADQLWFMTSIREEEEWRFTNPIDWLALLMPYYSASDLFTRQVKYNRHCH